MVRDNTITDGVCLKGGEGKSYLFYKEDAASIRMDLSKMPEARSAIAIGALQPERAVGQDRLIWASEGAN
jgi:hypothetical protein